jgi:hypothetical protein
MRFEHLVEINDPLMPLIGEVSRAQLWRGLVLRAEDPVQFVLGLERATITGREESGAVTSLARTLDFGSFQVHDRVRLFAPSHSEIITAAGASWPASRMTITIEEPQPRALYLRFVYEIGGESGDGRGLDEIARALREQAYTSADLDTVVRVRELAEQGRLG